MRLVGDKETRDAADLKTLKLQHQAELTELNANLMQIQAQQPDYDKPKEVVETKWDANAAIEKLTSEKLTAEEAAAKIIDDLCQSMRSWFQKDMQWRRLRPRLSETYSR